MNDAEIRMRCLEASVRILCARIAAGTEMREEETAGAFYGWVTRSNRAPNGLSGRPTERQGAGLTDEMLADVKSRVKSAAAPETGPDLPEHTGWAG